MHWTLSLSLVSGILYFSLTSVFMAIKLELSPSGNCESEGDVVNMALTDAHQDKHSTNSICHVYPHCWLQGNCPCIKHYTSSGRLQISYDGSKVSKMQNGHAGGCWSWGGGVVGLSPFLPGFPGCCGFRLRSRLIHCHVVLVQTFGLIQVEIRVQ